MTARDDILRRVRHALSDVQIRDEREPAPERREPQQPDDVVSLFVERVADYQAVVTRCTTSEARAAVASALSGTANVLVPEGFPDNLLPVGHRRVEDSGLSASVLDAVDAVVTTAAVGIAETGTIVLDHGPGQGRRAVTLVPDRHVCVVHVDQVVADVPEAVALLDPARPQTWISAARDIPASRKALNRARSHR